jgi:MFS family permease
LSVKYSSEFKRDLASSFNADLILPLYSVFLPLLAITLKASVLEIGVVGGAANAVYCFMPFVIGRLSDRQSARRFFVTTSFAILSIVSVSYIVIQNPIALIVARVFEGIGWAMLWPAIESAIRDSTSDAKKALSMFNFTWSGAAAAGPLLGASLIFFSTIREAFVITSAIMIATLVLNMIPLITKKRELTFEKNTQQIEPTTFVPQRSKLRARFYLSATVLAAVSSGVLYTFASSKSANISILIIGVATFMFGFARFFVYILTVNEHFRSLLLDARNRGTKIVISLVVLSLSSLLLLINNASGIIYVIVYGIAGASYSIVYAVSQAAMIAEAHPERVGRGAGMFESSIGAGQFLGPIAGGVVGTFLGNSLSAPFIVPSLSLAVFLLLTPIIMRKEI